MLLVRAEMRIVSRDRKMTPIAYLRRRVCQQAFLSQAPAVAGVPVAPAPGGGRSAGSGMAAPAAFRRVAVASVSACTRRRRLLFAEVVDRSSGEQTLRLRLRP